MGWVYPISIFFVKIYNYQLSNTEVNTMVLKGIQVVQHIAENAKGGKDSTILGKMQRLLIHKGDLVFLAPEEFSGLGNDKTIALFYNDVDNLLYQFEMIDDFDYSMKIVNIERVDTFYLNFLRNEIDKKNPGFK